MTVDLRLGDCLELMKSLPDKSVDAVITDPPYFLPANHYQTRKQFRRNFSDLSLLEFYFRGWFAELERIIKPSGVFYVFCDGQSYPLFYYYTYSFSKSARPLIWDKMNSVNGYGWRHQHELILYGEMPETRPLPTGDGDIIKMRAVPVGEREHPAQKPEDLVSLLAVKCGDTVLDPFMGSGTTGVACVKLNRNFIGMEINPQYFEIAKKRIEEAQKQMALI